ADRSQAGRRRQMSLSSAGFILAFLALAAVFFRVPTAGGRRALFAATNAVFLWLSVGNPPSWIALAAFLLSGFAVGRLLLRTHSRGLFTGYLLVMLAAFVVLKKYDVLALLLPGSILHHPIAVVGLSYMLFRQIHFLV